MSQTIRGIEKFFKCFNGIRFELIHITPMEEKVDIEIIEHFGLTEEILSKTKIFVNLNVPDYLYLMAAERISEICINTNQKKFSEIKIVTCKFGLQVFTCIDDLFIACFVRDIDYPKVISQIQSNIDVLNEGLFKTYMRYVLRFFM